MNLSLEYSVVIAAYRRPTLLRQTLSYLMPQVGSDGEVIVVEQCPLVDLRSELCAYDQLRHVVLPRPGAVEARNCAIQLATGRVLIFVDDDVVPPTGFIQAHLAAYDQADIGGVSGRVVESTHLGTGVVDARTRHPQDGWRYSTFDHDTEMDVPHAPTCNLSILRELVVRVGGFDPGFRLAWREDSDLCFRVRALGYRIRYRPDAWLTHLSASEGGTRGSKPELGYLSRTVAGYRKRHLHYRDNLYFIFKHFDGWNRLRWIWDAYRTYVGVSRWPWRLAAKNLIFIAALVQAWGKARNVKPPFFTPLEGLPQ